MGRVWDDGEVSPYTRHKRGEGVVAGVMEEEMGNYPCVAQDGSK